MWSFIKKTFTFITLAIALIWLSILISFIPKIGTIFGETDEPLKCSLSGSGEAPYHVFIQFDDGHPLCSGTLIREQYVLTLAHCVFNSHKEEVYNKEYMQVLVGTRTIPGGTPYGVEKVTCHPSFNHTTRKDDIAVLKLKKEVNIDNLVLPIRLPNNGMTPYKGLGLIARGYERKHMFIRDQHTSFMQAISNGTCQKLLKQLSWDSSGKFCAVADPGYSSCLIGDDKGSPVIPSDRHVIIGIAIKCVRGLETTPRKFPQIFTDVSSYITFINMAIEYTEE